MCKEKHCESSWLGKSVRSFLVCEHVNIHILLSVLWEYLHIVVCEKCIVQIEESVYYRWFVQAHSPVCSTLWIAQKSLTVFSCDVPDNDAAGQHALNGYPVESDENVYGL